MNKKILKKLAALLLAFAAAAAFSFPLMVSAEEGEEIIYNICDGWFGADGSDDIPDTDAIQGALDMAIDSGRKSITVYVPDGTYYIDRSLYIYSDTTLRLSANAVIVRANDRYSMLRSAALPDNPKSGGYTNTRNVVVEGGKWDGNVCDTGYCPVNIYMGHVENVTIRNTEFTGNCGTHLVELAGADNIHVENVVFSDYYLYDNESVEGVAYNKEALQLDITGKTFSAGFPPYDNTPCRNITITGCTFINFPCGIGTHNTVDGVFTEHVNIYGNRFYDIYNKCISVKAYRDFNVYDNYASGSNCLIRMENSEGSIHNNKIVNSSDEDVSLIESFTQEYSTRTGIQLSDSKGEIYDNSISRVCANGISLINGSDASVYRNNVTGAYNHGIAAYDSVISVSENTVSDVRVNGIYLDHSSGRIKENNIADTSGQGISLKDSKAEDCSGNIIFETDKNGVYLSGKSSAAVTGNIISQTGYNGISAGANSSLSASDNNIRNTVQNGIYLSGAKADIKQNRITASEVNGIRCVNSAHADISGNMITASQSHGISFNENADGIVNNNRVMLSSLNGISIYSRCSPEVTMNTVSSSGGYGFVLSGHASGLIMENDIIESRKNDIRIADKCSDVKICNNYTGKGSISVSKDSKSEQSGNVTYSRYVSISKISSKSYSGKNITPDVKIKFGPKTLKKGRDYTLSYSGNNSIGTASVKIKFKGGYAGAEKASFSIVPQKQIIASVKSSKKGCMTVKYKKDTKTSGYQIQYSLNKSFAKGNKSITASGTTGSVNGISAGKTYYVRVRSYKKVNGKNYYGFWSDARSIKIK